jgi:glycosyltransferase involved in cell wall biosynthesis
MNKFPLISVVIPSFQQAAFLEDCLRSVLEQEYPQKEIIVLDGGSTDGSVEIIRKYADRLAHWQSGPDGGQAAAVNQGWARARGEIFGWLNSDDRYAPGALQTLADAGVRAPSAVMWYGDVAEIDAAGCRLGVKRMAEFSQRTLLLGKNMGQSGVFIGRRAFQALGGLDVRLACALDFEYYLRIWSAFPAEDFVYLPSVVAESRLWGETKSSRQADGFGREYRLVMEEYFARTDLPVSVRALKTRAFSRAVFMRHARLCLEAGDGWRGLPLLARAVWREPEPLQKVRMIWLGCRTLWIAWCARAGWRNGKAK